MDFDLSDEQREIKDTARSLLSERSKPAKVREHAEARTRDDGLWKELCELGWPGIAIDEAQGGQGLGMVELATLCEELGYACAPVPFLSNAIAGIAIAEAGSDEQKSKWLPGIASGEGRGAAAVNRDDPALVLDADGAEVLVLPGGDGARLVAAADAEVEPLELIDATRSYARVSVSGGDELGDVNAAICKAQIANAAELTGIAHRALEMAVDYAKEREQFGRAIGSYQAVSHRCASMLLAFEESRSLTYYAAWVADAEPESLPLAAAMAGARAADAAWDVVNASLQVHGGIGFTWEHDLQFWFKRARAGGQMLGTAGEQRERVAELMLAGDEHPAVAEPA